MYYSDKIKSYLQYLSSAILKFSILSWGSPRRGVEGVEGVEGVYKWDLRAVKIIHYSQLHQIRTILIQSTTQLGDLKVNCLFSS